MSPQLLRRAVEALSTFKIETPSWGFADTGTRFGKFFQDAAAIDMNDKLADAGHVHALTGCCPTVAAHVLWDFKAGEDPKAVVKLARKHGVKIGFMSFFVKAAVHALKKYPVLNASVDGNDIVYHGYFDIGIAVGSPRGLVVPILRNADQMSFADIEKKIAEYGVKARDGKLGIEEMTGGTFSISNGGVFGSMLSTPIINPPQSAILGVHATKDRAVVENGQVVVRPMNYFAMSYDHRIIDGREAVLGLVAMKEALEDPARLLFDI
jgi:pyruvate/2-oxoglutarate dehydrogenase complex dihydrolipoamide acyltransferase (E2) component